MRAVLTRMTSVAVVVVTSIIVAISGAGPAAAAVTVGCGSWCDWKSPDFVHYEPDGRFRKCSADAVTKYRIDFAGNSGGETYWAELRYSPWCRTAWVRSPRMAWVESYHLNGTYRTTAEVYASRDGSVNSSVMLNDKNLIARACTGYPLAAPECTPFW